MIKPENKEKLKPDNQILLVAGLVIILMSLLGGYLGGDSRDYLWSGFGAIFLVIWACTSWSQRMLQ